MSFVDLGSMAKRFCMEKALEFMSVYSAYFYVVLVPGVEWLDWL